MKGAKWSTPTQIAEARRLRGLGKTYEEIKGATGLNLASISRYARDVVTPPTQAETTKSMRQYEREQAAASRDNKMLNRIQEDDSEAPTRYYPTTMPTEPSEFDTTGLFPDEKLIAHADAVIEGFVDAKAKGKLHHGVPIPVSQAQVVIGTLFRPWDQQWWRDSRDAWRQLREYCRLSSTEMAERCGISPSSLSRYENIKRTPSKRDSEKIRIAYWAALQYRLDNLEIWLGLEDYVDHLIDSQNLTTEHEDIKYEMDDAIRWISGVGADLEHYDEELRIDHLPSVAQIRALMPVPSYREEDQIVFNYVGFATATDDDASAA